MADHVTADPLAALRADVARYLVGCPPGDADKIVDDAAARWGMPLDHFSAFVDGLAQATRHGRATTTITLRQVAVGLATTEGQDMILAAANVVHILRAKAEGMH